MTVWVGEQDGGRAGPFEGCLVIINLDDPMPVDYRLMVKEAVDKAHCDGFAIVSLYEKGVVPYPEDIEAIEGFDFGRLFHSVWKGHAADFSPDPGVRREQFAALARAALAQKDFAFARKAVKIVGSCRIVGMTVVIPPVEFRHGELI